MESRLHLDHFDKVLELAQQGCSTLYDYLDETVRLHARPVE